MIIDCDECAVRGLACGDCVVTVLLGGPPEDVAGDPAGTMDIGRSAAGDRSGPYADKPGLLELDDTERWAVHNLAAAGLVPPLRMVPLRAEPLTQSERPLTPRRRTAGQL